MRLDISSGIYVYINCMYSTTEVTRQTPYRVLASVFRQTTCNIRISKRAFLCVCGDNASSAAGGSASFRRLAYLESAPAHHQSPAVRSPLDVCIIAKHLS